MTTLKDKLKEFREKDWKALEDYSSAGIALSKIENFWTTAIQEALESLQGEEKSLEGRSMLNRCQFFKIINMKLTKQQALEKIEELKKYVADEEAKEGKKVGSVIINSIFGNLRFQSTKSTIKEAVEEAVESGANLNNADLSGANLSGANLRGAEMQNVKFYGKGGTKELIRSQLPDFLAALGFKIID